MPAAFDHPGYRLWTTANELVGELFLVLIVEGLRRTVRALDAQRRVAQEALDEVTVLEQMLPACAWCKRVRDDQGYWSQLEAYLTKKGLTRFSHGICPNCLEKVHQEHPEIFGGKEG